MTALNEVKVEPCLSANDDKPLGFSDSSVKPETGGFEWGKAPRKLSIPAYRPKISQTAKAKEEALNKSNIASQNQPKPSNQKQSEGKKFHKRKSSSKNSTQSGTSGQSKAVPTPPVFRFDERWAEDMPPAEKAALIQAPEHDCVTVRAGPCEGFPAQKPSRRVSDGGQPLRPLAIAKRGVPKKLLIAYFNLARKLLRGPRSTWNVFELAVNVKRLIEWASQDALSAESTDVDLQGLSAEETITLWATSMTMQSQRARKSIEKQFKAVIDELALDETLEAWHSAQEHEVKPAQRLLKDRLHNFAWAKYTQRSSLPFVDVEMMFIAAPDASFCRAAMEKLAWSMLRRDPYKDSQFLAMSEAFKSVFMDIFTDCKAKDEFKKATYSAHANQRPRENYEVTPPRAVGPPEQTQGYVVIDAEP